MGAGRYRAIGRTQVRCGPASVAQWIEHRFPKPCVAGSIPARGARIGPARSLFRAVGGVELDGVAPDLRPIEAHAELRDALMASSISAAQIATSFLLGVVTGSERGVTMNQRIRAAIALRQGVVAWTDREGIGR